MLESDSDDDEPTPAKAQRANKENRAAAATRPAEVEKKSVSPADFFSKKQNPVPRTTPPKPAETLSEEKSNKKRKSPESPVKSETPVKKKKTEKAKISEPKKAKNTKVPEAEVQKPKKKKLPVPEAIIEPETSEPKIEPKKEPETPSDAKKFNYFKYKAKMDQGPKNPGSKEIPTGAENCLEGLIFVITGQGDSLGRDETKSLIERYAGKVTSAISGNLFFQFYFKNSV